MFSFFNILESNTIKLMIPIISHYFISFLFYFYVVFFYNSVSMSNESREKVIRGHVPLPRLAYRMN